MTEFRPLLDIPVEELDRVLALLHEAGISAQTMAVWEQIRELPAELAEWNAENPDPLDQTDIRGKLASDWESDRDTAREFVSDHYYDVTAAAKHAGLVPDDYEPWNY